MKTLVDQLSSYADYHRDPRNIVTHYIGGQPVTSSRPRGPTTKSVPSATARA